jgi:AcrR family transcriptional regulator
MANVRYVNWVARSPDLHRRPELLAEIVDYLLDKPLSTVSFRTLAEGLRVSTYQLVYHFGNRAGLIEAIIQTVADRETIIRSTAVQPAVKPAAEPPTRPAAGPAVLPAATQKTATTNACSTSTNQETPPRGRQLQRLEFEAAILENLDGQVGRVATSTHYRWVRSGVASLEHLGVPSDLALVETRGLVDAMYGMHYDLILGNDLADVTLTYDRTMALFRARIEAILGATGERAPTT